MTLGAVDATRMSAGLEAAFTMRCQALSGTALPLEAVRFLLIVGPDLGRAPAFDNDHDFFVHMTLGIERPGARDLDHVATPTAFGAVELDEGSVAAHAVPTLERHVLYSPH